ncbi:MAG: hypothetical protein GKR95_19795 [Gammaproteobacteria bacterium]|nr:hypothetical protein [Gammaproteobacteria bacterium]
MNEAVDTEVIEIKASDLEETDVSVSADDLEGLRNLPKNVTKRSLPRTAVVKGKEVIKRDILFEFTPKKGFIMSLEILNSKKKDKNGKPFSNTAVKYSIDGRSAGKVAVGIQSNPIELRLAENAKSVIVKLELDSKAEGARVKFFLRLTHREE